MDCSRSGLPVHHQLPESTQTHVHWVGDAIQPFHPLSSPFPPAFNLSQHQGLFQWVSSSHQAAKLLEFQLQHQSFYWTVRTDLLYDGLFGSLWCPRDSQRVFSNTIVQFLSLKKQTTTKKNTLLFRTSGFASAWALSCFYWLRVAGQCCSVGNLRLVSIWAWAEGQHERDES